MEYNNTKVIRGARLTYKADLVESRICDFIQWTSTRMCICINFCSRSFDIAVKTYVPIFCF